MKQNLFYKNGCKTLLIALFSVGLLLISRPSSAQEVVTNNTQGTHDGFFYSFWKENSQGSVSMTLYPGGRYTTTWNNILNFTAGKGWKVGKVDRTVCFEGSYNGGSNGFLAVYGWTKDPLIEYYVVESYGQWTPPGNTSDIISKGSFTSDGGTYNMFVSTRTNKPSIIGEATFQQYWSVRTSKRSSGTVTFANHVAAWEKQGMKMGTTWDYQIMESEGYNSSGSSDITVSECFSCATKAPTVTATVSYELGQQANQLTAQGTALKWYTTESGGTASTTAPTPNTTTTGVTTYYVSQTANGCEGPRASITVSVIETYMIFKTPIPIVIDGTIDEAWNNPSVLQAKCTKTLVGTISNSADLSGYFKALWDNTYLYILADVDDNALVKDSDNIYDDDAVEVYIDINNDKASTYGNNDFQYTFAWDRGTTVGVLPSGRSTSNITYSIVAKTGGYIVEARIPWATVQDSPAVNQSIGIDFMINDDDNSGARDKKTSWNANTDDAWQNPSLFGTAQLREAIEVITNIFDAQNLSGIEIFPNPVVDKINLTLHDSKSTVSLYTISGRQLTELNPESHQLSIDMSNYDSGIYLLKIITNGQTVTKKVVKK
jgi:hypothetical protein